MEDQKRDKEREERREEEKIARELERERERREQIERDDKRWREDREQQAKLLVTLKEAQPAVPQKVTINSNRLPVMKDHDDIEIFIPQFEAALISMKVPRDEWKGYIHSQVTAEPKEKVMHLLTDEDSTYEDIKRRLLGTASMSFANTAESIFSPMTLDRTKQGSRKMNQITRWVDKLVQEAESYKEAAQKVAIAYLRSKMIPEFKNYTDLTEADSNPRYIIKMEEWVKSHPEIKEQFKLYVPYTAHRQTGESNTQGIQERHHMFLLWEGGTCIP